MAGPDTRRDVARGFAENLIRVRRRTGYSQEQLGFLAGLHRTEIGMLERGIRLARIDTVIKLAGALEVDACELLRGITWISGSYKSGAFSTEDGSR